MNVLVAEDSDVNRKIIMQIISELGHTVCAAENGLEAVELFKNQDDKKKIDLIVMDAEMPVMDGMTSTAEIRIIAGDDWLPIIFLSSHTENRYLQKALDSGADVYLRKPINNVKLAAQIKAMGRIVDMKKKLDEANTKLHDLANQDGLTKIANRRAFNERINYELKQSHRNKIPFSLVLCDIDYFKLYNDTYGHLAGDNCLKKVAKTIERSFRRETDMVARYGGEEFAILLPGTNSVEARPLVENMLNSINTLDIPHSSSDVAKHITISAGVVTHSDEKNETSVNAFIDLADKNLYEAKENGRNRIIISA